MIFFQICFDSENNYENGRGSVTLKDRKGEGAGGAEVRRGSLACRACSWHNYLYNGRVISLRATSSHFLAHSRTEFLVPPLLYLPWIHAALSFSSDFKASNTYHAIFLFTTIGTKWHLRHSVLRRHSEGLNCYLCSTLLRKQLEINNLKIIPYICPGILFVT